MCLFWALEEIEMFWKKTQESLKSSKIESNIRKFDYLSIVSYPKLDLFKAQLKASKFQYFQKIIKTLNVQKSW